MNEIVAYDDMKAEQDEIEEYNENVDSDQTKVQQKVEPKKTLEILDPHTNMEIIRAKLKHRVQCLVEECRDYPILLEMNQSLKKNIVRLEIGVICQFRSKMLQLRKVQYYSQCNQMKLGEKTIVCLEKDLSERQKDIEFVENQIVTMVMSKTEIADRMKECKKRIEDMINMSANMEGEIIRLLEQAAMQNVSIQDKQEVFQNEKFKLMRLIQEKETEYKETAKNQLRTLSNLGLGNKDLKTEIKKLTKNIEQEKDTFKMLTCEKADICSKIKTLKEEIDDRETFIQKKNSHFGSCNDQICKLVEYKQQQERRIDELQCQLCSYQQGNKEHVNETELYREKIMEYEENLSRYNEIKKKLVEENAVLNKKNNEMKCALEDESQINSAKEKIEAMFKDIQDALNTLKYLVEKKTCLENEIKNMEQNLAELQLKKNSAIETYKTEEDGKLLESKRNILAKICEENAVLQERYTELKETKDMKDKQIQEIKLMKSYLCSNYATLLKKTEKYAEILKHQTDKIRGLEDDLDILNSEKEVLTIKEERLKGDLEKLEAELNSKREEHDKELKRNELLRENINKVFDQISNAQENNSKLKKCIEESHDNQHYTIEETKEVMDRINEQKTLLINKNHELKHEYDMLKTKYNLVMQSNGMLAKIIKMYKCELDDDQEEPMVDSVESVCGFSVNCDESTNEFIVNTPDASHREHNPSLEYAERILECSVTSLGPDDSQTSQYYDQSSKYCNEHDYHSSYPITYSENNWESEDTNSNATLEQDTQYDDRHDVCQSFFNILDLVEDC